MAVTVEQKTKMYDTPENTSINEAHGIPSQNPDAPSEWGWQSFLTLINHLGVNFSQIKGVAQSATNPGASKVGDVWFWGDYGSYPYFGQPVTEFNQIGFFLKGASSWSKYTIKTLYSYSIKDGETGETIEKQLDDVTRYNSSTGNFELRGESIRDATITLNAFSQAVLDYIGSGGTITNNPDERHLDKFTDGVEKLRVKDGFEGKTYLYNPGQYATSADLKTAVEALVSGGNVHLVIDENVDGGGLTWTLPTGTILHFSTTGYVDNVDFDFTDCDIKCNENQQCFGSGCTFTGTIKNKIVHLKWLGTIDNTGVSDASVKINKIIDLLSSDQKVVFETGAIYLIDAEPILVQKDRIDMDGNGCIFELNLSSPNADPTLPNALVKGIHIKEKSFVGYFDSRMDADSNKIIVETTDTGIEVGQLVQLMNSSLSTYYLIGYEVTEINDELVDGITKRVVTINGKSNYDYGTGNKVRFHNKTVGVKVHGFNINCSTDITKHYQDAIFFEYVEGCSAYDNTINGNDYGSAGIRTYGNSNTFYGNKIKNFLMRPYIMSGTYSGWGSLANGYGISYNGRGHKAYLNDVSDCRHSLQTSHSFDCSYLVNTCSNSEYAFRQEVAADALPDTGYHVLDSHETSFRTTFIGNIVTNSITTGAVLRGDSITFQGNVMTMKKAQQGNVVLDSYLLSGIQINAFDDYCNNHIIEGNTVNMSDEDINNGVTLNQSLIFQGTDNHTIRDIIISNNNFSGVVNLGIPDASSASSGQLSGCNFTGNTVRGGINVSNATDIDIKTNKIYYGIGDDTLATRGVRLHYNVDDIEISGNNKFICEATTDFSNNIALDGYDVTTLTNIRFKNNHIYVKNGTGWNVQTKLDLRTNIPATEYSISNNTYKSDDVIFPHLEFGIGARLGGNTSSRDLLFPFQGMEYINRQTYKLEVWNGYSWVDRDGDSAVVQGNGSDVSALTTYTLDVRKNRLFKKTIGAATTFTFNIDGYAVGQFIKFNIWAEANAGVGVAPSYALSTGTLTVESKASNYDNTLFTNIEVGLKITASGADAVIYETSA